MSSVACDDITTNDDSHVVASVIFGPNNALLLAARMLVEAGYRFEQVNYRLAVAMECLQEEPRDASA